MEKSEYFSKSLSYLIKLCHDSYKSCEVKSSFSNKLLYEIIFQNDQNIKNLSMRTGIFKNQIQNSGKYWPRGRTILLAAAYIIDSSYKRNFFECFYKTKLSSCLQFDIENFKNWLKESLFKFKTTNESNKIIDQINYNIIIKKIETSYIKNIKLNYTGDLGIVEFDRNSKYSNICLQILSNTFTHSELFPSSNSSKFENPNTKNLPPVFIVTDINSRYKSKISSGINLKRANLKNKNMSKSNLSGANLSEANLIDANLSYSDLSYALLNKANLSGANLTGAKLLRTSFNETNMLGTNLECTVFTKRPGVSRNFIRNTILFLKKDEAGYDHLDHFKRAKENEELYPKVEKELNEYIEKMKNNKEFMKKNLDAYKKAWMKPFTQAPAEQRINEILEIVNIFIPNKKYLEKESSLCIPKYEIEYEDIINSNLAYYYPFVIDIYGKIIFRSFGTMHPYPPFTAYPDLCIIKQPVIAIGFVYFDGKNFSKIYNFSNVYCPDGISLEIAETLFCYNYFDRSKNIEKYYFNYKTNSFSKNYIPNKKLSSDNKIENLRPDNMLNDSYYYTHNKTKVSHLFRGQDLDAHKQK